MGEDALPPQPTTNTATWDALQQLVENCTVETGMRDLAHQHNHYLYGKPKRDGKTVVHCSDFDCKVGHLQLTNGQAIDALNEDELRATDTPHALHGIIRFGL